MKKVKVAKTIASFSRPGRVKMSYDQVAPDSVRDVIPGHHRNKFTSETSEHQYNLNTKGPTFKHSERKSSTGRVVHGEASFHNTHYDHVTDVNVVKSGGAGLGISGVAYGLHKNKGRSAKKSNHGA